MTATATVAVADTAPGGVRSPARSATAQGAGEDRQTDGQADGREAVTAEANPEQSNTHADNGDADDDEADEARLRASEKGSPSKGVALWAESPSRAPSNLVPPALWA